MSALLKPNWLSNLATNSPLSLSSNIPSSLASSISSFIFFILSTSEASEPNICNSSLTPRTVSAAIFLISCLGSVALIPLNGEALGCLAVAFLASEAILALTALLATPLATSLVVLAPTEAALICCAPAIPRTPLTSLSSLFFSSVQASAIVLPVSPPTC